MRVIERREACISCGGPRVGSETKRCSQCQDEIDRYILDNKYRLFNMHQDEKELEKEIRFRQGYTQ